VWGIWTGNLRIGAGWIGDFCTGTVWIGGCGLDRDSLAGHGLGGCGVAGHSFSYVFGSTFGGGFLVIREGEGTEAEEALFLGFFFGFEFGEGLGVIDAPHPEEEVIGVLLESGLTEFADVLAVATDAVEERIATGFLFAERGSVFVVFEGADRFPDGLFNAGDDFGGDLDAVEVGSGFAALDAAFAHGGEGLIDGEQNAA
jgi:hypothetical protein